MEQAQSLVNVTAIRPIVLLADRAVHYVYPIPRIAAPPRGAGAAEVDLPVSVDAARFGPSLTRRSAL